MQLHNVQPIHENKPTMLVGRGGKRGKTSGRGTKGQSARAGNKKRPEIRDFIKRLPKLRGRGKNINTSIQSKPSVVSLKTLDMVCKADDAVNPAFLVQKGVVRTISGNLPVVKILSTGE